jgi:hypothetical protein
MAENAIQSDIFKFVALRPAVPINEKNRRLKFICDNRVPERTMIGELLQKFKSPDEAHFTEQLRMFMARNNLSLDYPKNTGDLTLSNIYDSISIIQKQDFNTDKIIETIQSILGKPIAEFLNDPKSEIQLNSIWDSYYGFYILRRTEQHNLDSLTKSLRIYHLLDYLKVDSIDDYKTFISLLVAKPLIPKQFSFTEKPPERRNAVPEKIVPTDTVLAYKQLWSDFVDTHMALEEVKNIKYDVKTSSQIQDATVPNRVTGIAEQSKFVSVKSNLSINKQSFENLLLKAKSVLGGLNLEHDFQIADSFNLLKNKLTNINLSIANINDPEFLKHMPAEAKLISGTSLIIGKLINVPSSIIPFNQPTSIRASIKPLGIGDLKVVKQKLVKYVSGEVAHIENVLRGEYKERKHRVFDRTEDIFTVSSETDEETTKDTQTTERFELKKETEKTVEEKMNLAAGITVSGSYGMVTFGAYGDFAYSTSNQETNNNSSNFAREVIDKSVSKIQKKTKEERTSKTLHEVEEINTHGIDNKDKSDHAVGIYRWVDKYYEAQIYNYGKRMMFEFIIPEPAAFFEYAQKNKPKKNLTIPIVPYKWIQDINGKWVTDGIITHKDVNEYNYQGYIRDYNVQGVTPAPVPFKTVATSITKEGLIPDGNGHVSNSKELVVPAGYISKLGVWYDCSAFFTNFPNLEITIGNKIFRLLEGPPGGAAMMANNHQDQGGYHWFWPETSIQISVNSYDVISYTINAYIFVERTAEAYEQWQILTYEKIMTAYKLMQTEYDQKVAALEIQGGIAIQGQNPIINRDIEAIELKKQCIKLLMDFNLFGSFDAMKNPDNTKAPDFDVFDAFEEGKIIQFFEQAFEWQNLTYLFYPYFWSRQSEWIHKINTYDTDPLFTKFLQAGSARVVIPVHPGYNDAIIYFLQHNGVIWNGGGPPQLNEDETDPMFISIADEIRNQTDDLANAVPEGVPWEVVLPTNLVYLQQDAILPVF